MDSWQGPYTGLERLLTVWAVAVVVLGIAVSVAAVAWLRTRHVARPALEARWQEWSRRVSG